MSRSLKPLAALALVLAAAIPFGPAAAAPMPAVPPAGCVDMDRVVAGFRNHGEHVYLIPSDRLPTIVRDASEITRQSYGFVTRGFLVLGPASIVLGFEVGGCLGNPIELRPPQLQAMA